MKQPKVQGSRFLMAEAKAGSTLEIFFLIAANSLARCVSMLNALGVVLLFYYMPSMPNTPTFQLLRRCQLRLSIAH